MIAILPTCQMFKLLANKKKKQTDRQKNTQIADTKYQIKTEGRTGGEIIVKDIHIDSIRYAGGYARHECYMRIDNDGGRATERTSDLLTEKKIDVRTIKINKPISIEQGNNK